MNTYSNWNNIDLHIHSKESSKVKKNDYKGEEYSAKKLLDTLVENEINIFSVTDHNCVNESLYRDIQKELDSEPYCSKQINYIIGVELDIDDEKVHDKTFHALVFFDTKDVCKVSTIVDNIFNNVDYSDREADNFPNVSKIFSEVSSEGVENILIIPHFNNKSKGIPSNKGVENLNYLCFNAYEDTNNIQKIQESLNIYLNKGFDNFPFAIFSDCHDLELYPERINENNEKEKYLVSSILGSNSYPFNSVKTAFQEPRMRINIESVENMRSKEEVTFIEKIQVGESEFIELSPSQNTIVGRFGSGKSLLIEKILKGKRNLENIPKYSRFYKESDTFKLISNGNSFDSITEYLQANSSTIKYEYKQMEEFYYKSSLDYQEINELLPRINIIYDVNSQFVELNIEEEISEAINNLISYFEINGKINNLNYKKAFTKNKSFRVNQIKPDEYNYIETNNEFENLLDLSRHFSGVSIYDNTISNVEEKTIIEEFNILVENKKGIIQNISKTQFEENQGVLIDTFKNESLEDTAKESKDKLIQDFTSFLGSIKELYKAINKFDRLYNEEVTTSLLQEKEYIVNEKIKVVSKYAEPAEEFVSLNNHLFTQANIKETLQKSIINALDKKLTFKRNGKISDSETEITKYIELQEDKYKISNTSHSIIYNNENILEKSAGEKSSLFITLLFELIENDLANGKSVILILDQPEDNIDNENTYKLISSRIKSIKLISPKFQVIVVTHNANVGITADSENIVIASEEILSNGEKSFVYTSGAIENEEHINDVCMILEGGLAALRMRSVKYGINVIRKVEQDGN